MRERTPRRLVATAVTAVATVATLIGSPGAAQAAPRHTRVVALTPSVPSTGPKLAAVQAKPNKATCKDDNTKHRRTCVKIGGTAPKHSAPKGTMSPAVAGVWCADYAADEWWVERFGACVHDEEITYTLEDMETGELLGEALIALDQEIELAPTSPEWVEDNFLTPIAMEGEVGGLGAEVTAACEGSCTPDDPVEAGELVLDEPLQLPFAFTADVGPGAQTPVDTAYTVMFTQPDTIPLEDGAFWGPGDIRCDNAVGTSAGCVDTDYPAIMTYSLSDSSVAQAAAGYLFAQNVLPDHWGTQGHELHRIADAAIANANRNVVCDSTFVPNPALNPVTDSCDEFAFAATQESGAQLGLTGANCDEIYPFQNGGEWYVQEFRFTGTEHCQQAHVENSANGAAGLALGRFAQQQRVLDGEAYQLEITA